MTKNEKTGKPVRDIHQFGFELQHKRTQNSQSTPMHRHDFYEIYLLLAGNVTYCVEGQLYQIAPGDIILIQPQEQHEVVIGEGDMDYERLVLWLDPKQLIRLSTEGSDLEMVFRTERAEYSRLLHPDRMAYTRLRGLMEQLYQEIRHDRFGGDILRLSLLAQILVELNRLSVTTEVPKDNIPIGTVTQIIDYIDRQYNRPISLDHLADRFSLNKYYISHAFKEHTGVSVGRYLVKRRLKMARELLVQGGKPSKVGILCGFSDYNSFYRAFRADYGVSPRAYLRQLNRSGEQ